jgi:hypothetical protein
MLQTLLLYFGDTQREGRLVTRRIRSTFILWALAGVFFVIAFIAALIAGSIYLAKELGAGPAALVIAGAAFLLGVIMLIILAIMRRPRAYVANPIAPLAAAPLAVQALAASALQARPFTTLLTALALGFIATRTTVKKKK